ncbi:hypothetical protein PENSPDRAFT_651052 [Peniophora sp. CONT]|nr:hypothetical protein PENSPDRAFT_651052 [Peniophora sp. CONT]
MRFTLSAIFVLATSLFAAGVSAEQVIMSSPQGSNLFDLLTIEPSVSIFFSYARETEISKLLVDTSIKNTLLVPNNRAVMALARKPHQDTSPVDNSIEMTEQEFDEHSKSNVLRWVSMHIIPVADIEPTDREYPTLADDKSIVFKVVDKDSEKPDWARVAIDGVTHLVQKKEASNGVFYIIDGTVKDE